MIKFYNQVPTVYSNTSRDFQYLSWLINIVLNSVNQNVDEIYDLTNSKNDHRLNELLALTLGFKVKRNYDQSQLRALVAALPRILKYKGTKAAVEMAGNALIAASGAAGSFDISEDKLAEGELVVSLPLELIDISLFTDLLEYILPAGMTYKVEREQLAKENPSNKFALSDMAVAEWIPDLTWDTDPIAKVDTAVGLASMYEAGKYPVAFTNFINSNETLLNTGLLNNNIIPALTETLHMPDSAAQTTTISETGGNKAKP